jgi:hypothetical protein
LAVDYDGFDESGVRMAKLVPNNRLCDWSAVIKQLVKGGASLIGGAGLSAEITIAVAARDLPFIQ